MLNASFGHATDFNPRPTPSKLQHASPEFYLYAITGERTGEIFHQRCLSISQSELHFPTNVTETFLLSCQRLGADTLGVSGVESPNEVQREASCLCSFRPGVISAQVICNRAW